MGGNVGTILSYPMYGLILDRLGWEVRVYEVTSIKTLAVLSHREKSNDRIIFHFIFNRQYFTSEVDAAYFGSSAGSYL